MESFSVDRKTLRNLRGKFARRSENEDTDIPGSQLVSAFGQQLENRERECGCFAGSCLSTGQNIFSIQNERNRLGLNRSRGLVTLRFDGVKDRFDEVQGVKFHERNLALFDTQCQS